MSNNDVPNGKAFSWVMTLADPTQVDELRFWLSQPEIKKGIRAALARMHNLHYARFLPLRDQGQILFVAEFDEINGADFVKELGKQLSDPLSELLQHMKGKPPLPIADNLDAFVAYVRAGQGMEASPFSAYKGKSVKDILEKMPAALGEPDENAAEGPGGAINAVQSKVGGGFSLLMTLEDPQRLLELMARLAEDFTKARIDKALASLDYVHYARFLPLFDRGALMIITEFDGVMRDYVMDFAAALDREFSMVLAYMKERPPLPVSEYPNEFWAYVDGHLVADTGLYSAYPGLTVLDIVGTDKAKDLPERPKPPTPDVNLKDVQGNVLRGFGGTRAFHYYLRFPNAESGRKFVAACKATAAADVPDRKVDTKSVCRNIGFTHAGLVALGVPPPLLAAFPEAFREGPAKRAARNGDGDAADWTIGETGDADIHAVVSLQCREDADAELKRNELEELITSHNLPVHHGIDKQVLYGQYAEALPDARVHFGYRDGISHPHIASKQDAPEGGPASNQAQPGDFLLGPDYVNSRGGHYIGKLVESLALNGTYAAFRVIEQDVALFEDWLKKTAAVYEAQGVTPDLLAAKLMGRWKDGTPLTRHDQPKAEALTPRELNDFNYLSSDDRLGQRCPIGAHIRRFNPRDGMVLGLPWGKMVLRRGLPFGPKYDEANPDEEPRGLVGMFLCGDLEGQFEFLLKVWARNDLSSFGLRGTSDPFTNSEKDKPTPFHFVTEKAPEGITVDVPSVIKTTGSLYLFMPGLSGLKWIGGAGWTAVFPPPMPKLAANPAQAQQLDPTTPEFRDAPYGFYTTLRARQPVLKVGHGHDSYWVFSHQLVTEVCKPENQDLFLKPGKNRLPARRPFGINGTKPDGLFFMDPPRHSEVRPQLDQVFQRAIDPVVEQLGKKAENLLDVRGGMSTMHLVREYASRMAVDAFMEVMGIPVHEFNLERQMVEAWTRAMLAGHDFLAPAAMQAKAGSSSLALHAYLATLTEENTPQSEQERKATCPVASTHIMSGLGKLTGCPVKGMDPLNHDEATNTASHFALGGYLSTEFLITTGVYNLLRHPEQWALLNEEPKLIDGAVWEMLRYDAPFQMADRYVARDCELGGVALPKHARLTVVYGSANRDEIFDKPDRFNIERDYLKAAPIYGFGHGIHRCIGEELALRISKAAIGTLVQRYRHAKLIDTGAWLGDPYFRSLTEVTISLT